MRRQHRTGRLLAAGLEGGVARHRRRRLPRGRRRGVRRCCQGALHAAHGTAALHRAAVGGDRYPVAQYHLDPDARYQPRAQFHRRELLRRPGLHGASQAQGEKREAAQGRHGLRATRHHHRAQPRGLLPRQPHELQAGGDREAGGGDERLHQRALRCLHHRPLRADRAARHARAQARRARHPAGDHLQGAARPGGAPRRRPLVRRGEMVVLRHGGGGRAGPQLEQRRQAGQERQPVDPALRRHHRRHW